MRIFYVFLVLFFMACAHKTVSKNASIVIQCVHGTFAFTSEKHKLVHGDISYHKYVENKNKFRKWKRPLKKCQYATGSFKMNGNVLN